MEGNSFNIIELYAKVFGIKGVRFAISSNTPQGNNGGEFEYSPLALPVPPQARALSILGTPIYEQITFKNKDFEYTLPDWPLIDIAGANIIVKTPINKRKGTVKEYINEDDYQVNIRGILINYYSDEYPYDLLEEFQQIFKKKEALQVTSPVLNILDIHNLVIENVRYPEVEGFNHIQPFVLQCLSDEPIELEIKSANNQTKIIRGL